MSFAVPAGLVSGLATFLLYGVSRLDTFDLSLQQSRTAATTMMIVLGLVVLFELIEPKELHHLMMLGGLFAGYLFVLAIPPLRELFDLTVPQWQAWLVIAAVSIVAGLVMRILIGLAGRYVEDRYGVAPS
jgi:cation-transporting ATPase E